MSFAEGARSILSHMGAASGALGAKSEQGYVVDHVVRKFALGRILAAPQDAGMVDWSRITRNQLRLLCADQSEYLNNFPENYTAADISDALFGRPDWGLLASCYACLWGEVCKAWTIDDEKSKHLLKAVRSPVFLRSVIAYKGANHNVSPHPAVAWGDYSSAKKQALLFPLRRKGS